MEIEYKILNRARPGNISTDLVTTTCYLLLSLVYTYSSLSKLQNFEETKRQMLNQPIPEWSAGILAWLIPAIELITVLLLYFPQTRKTGFKLSTLLLLVFTLYVLLALLDLLGATACTCGGLISYLSWDAHLLFNITLLILSITGLLLKERRKT